MSNSNAPVTVAQMVEDARNLGRQLKSIAALGDYLAPIVSLENLEREIHTRVAQAREAETTAVKAMEDAQAALAAVKADADKTLKAAAVKADKILADAHAEAEKTAKRSREQAAAHDKELADNIEAFSRFKGEQQALALQYTNETKAAKEKLDAINAELARVQAKFQ